MMGLITAGGEALDDVESVVGRLSEEDEWRSPIE